MEWSWPLPVPNPSQVVKLASRTPSGTFDDMSYRDFVDYRDKLQSFDGLAAYSLMPFGFCQRFQGAITNEVWIPGEWEFLPRDGDGAALRTRIQSRRRPGSRKGRGYCACACILGERVRR